MFRPQVGDAIQDASDLIGNDRGALALVFASRLSCCSKASNTQSERLYFTSKLYSGIIYKYKSVCHVIARRAPNFVELDRSTLVNKAMSKTAVSPPTFTPAHSSHHSPNMRNSHIFHLNKGIINTGPSLPHNRLLLHNSFFIHVYIDHT